MDKSIIAQNIKQLRREQGLTQEQLSGKAGVSLAAIKNIELGKTSPRVETLSAIANALNVDMTAFLSEKQILKSVRFRCNNKMRSRSRIIEDVAYWLKTYNELETYLGIDRLNKAINEIRRKCIGLKPEEMAENCRTMMCIDAEQPIQDICGLLEHNGIKVYTVSVESDGFFGLSVGDEDGGPAIVVNTAGISVERSIYTAAHELGHILLHQNSFISEETEEDPSQEPEADVFASYFLMPETAFRKEWNKTYGLSFIDRILKVKQLFKVSYLTVLRRLMDMGRLDADKNWVMIFRAQYKRKHGVLSQKTEPFPLNTFLFCEDGLSRLVFDALKQGKVDIERGAEILNITYDEMLERLTVTEAEGEI